MDKYEVLKQYFGYTAFRDGQEQLVDAVLEERDVFGIMPTGGGKSICYQLPALMKSGVAIVVSPLISLMKDQVTALRNMGVSAAYINSSLTSEQLAAAYRRMRDGEYKIVYVAPERLSGQGFISLARGLDISMIAVDEAHCISQWGQDFRPSYLKILDFIELMPKRPVLAAFTATATLRVREDVERILKLHDPLRVVTGFDRPNLSFEVLKPAGKTPMLMKLLSERGDRSGIIYCSTRNTVEKLHDELKKRKIKVTKYHAGLSDEERRKNQEDFIYDRRTVMIATNAFGMGIDKSNVGYVIHYNMPKSLEAYYQEAGRAGRDGEKAECILLYSPGDIQTSKFLIQNSDENDSLTPEERRDVTRSELDRLNTMIQYCKTTACLRGCILDYFGQTHVENCGNCSNCRTNYTVKDITVEAQMTLSCIKRVQDKLGYSLGAVMIARVLKGSRDKRIITMGLDTLSTYGLMSSAAIERITDMLDFLEDSGYIRTDPVHGGVGLTVAAHEILFGQKKVEMPIREATTVHETRNKARAATYTGADNGACFEALRTLRFRIAKEERVPAYVIFSNATLSDMAEKLPKSLDELMEVSGVGEVKAERFGGKFLEEIAKFQ